MSFTKRRQNKIMFPMEFHPLHHKHKVLKDATPCQILCPRCGRQLGPAILMTLTAHELSTWLFATTMAYLPSLRLIGTQEPAPPWRLHVIMFRARQEITAATEDCSLLPGGRLPCPSVMFPSKNECTPTFSWCLTIR